MTKNEVCKMCVNHVDKMICKYEDTCRLVGILKENANLKSELKNVKEELNELRSSIKESDEELIERLKKMISEMRECTPEENEAFDKYLKSVSEPTGISIWDLIGDKGE